VIPVCPVTHTASGLARYNASRDIVPRQTRTVAYLQTTSTILLPRYCPQHYFFDLRLSICLSRPPCDIIHRECSAFVARPQTRL